MNVKVSKKTLRWLIPSAGTAISGLLLTLAFATGGNAATAQVASVEGEAMTSVEGYGTTVKSSSTASGGKYLLVDSAVRVRKTFSNTTAFNQVVVRARTGTGDENPGAQIRVWIDSTVIATFYVNKSTWTDFPIPYVHNTGTHTLTIKFLNPDARNLGLDITKFNDTSSPTPTPTQTSASPTPTFSQSPAPSPTGTTTSPAPSPTETSPSPTTPPSNETQMTAFVTGYSWYDNTPPGSADISHPVLHQQADGTGTYADPITMAVGHDLSSGSDVLDWPAGTRFYIPNLRRYFIVEDTCGDGPTPENGPCHTGYSAPATTWLDVWVGGENGTDAGDDACMEAITDNWTVIKDPDPDYVVVAGDIYGPTCTQQYGNTAVKA